jgi:D-sedoheptulose 7-phosphate isomerase
MTTDAATAAALAEERIQASAAAITALREPARIDAITRAAAMIAATLQGGGKVLLFGNGGSAADATHIAAEFVGRFLLERRALPALSLSDNASAVTAIGNDFGYAHVFARQIEALAARGDVALGISTSGRSANVLAGLAAARDAGLGTIGLTGADGGPLRDVADVCIEAPSDETPRIQEAHTLIGHLLCELVEREIA